MTLSGSWNEVSCLSSLGELGTLERDCFSLGKHGTSVYLSCNSSEDEEAHLKVFIVL